MLATPECDPESGAGLLLDDDFFEPWLSVALQGLKEEQDAPAPAAEAVPHSLERSPVCLASAHVPHLEASKTTDAYSEAPYSLRDCAAVGPVVDEGVFLAALPTVAEARKERLRAKNRRNQKAYRVRLKVTALPEFTLLRECTQFV